MTQATDPLISIVIPIYNTSPFLEECLNSVLNQKKVNLEIICVDDKSTDKSLGILERFAKKDRRLKIVKHEKNFGLPNARNSGVKHASGKYIIHLDSDDYWIGQDALYDIVCIAEIDQCDILRFNGKLKDGKDEDKPLAPISDSMNTSIENYSFLWIFRSVYLFLWRVDFVVRNNINFLGDITIGGDGIFFSSALAKKTGISPT
mgnify:CR=1 FL=1